MAQSVGANEETSGERADARRQLVEDARLLASDVQDAVEQTRAELREHLDRRPYLTLGVVAAAGYVLGGGLASRLTAVALGASGRVATAVVVRELTNGLRSKGGR